MPTLLPTSCSASEAITASIRCNTIFTTSQLGCGPSDQRHRRWAGRHQCALRQTLPRSLPPTSVPGCRRPIGDARLLLIPFSIFAVYPALQCAVERMLLASATELRHPGRQLCEAGGALATRYRIIVIARAVRLQMRLLKGAAEAGTVRGLSKCVLGCRVLPLRLFGMTTPISRRPKRRTSLPPYTQLLLTAGSSNNCCQQQLSLATQR